MASSSAPAASMRDWPSCNSKWLGTRRQGWRRSSARASVDAQTPGGAIGRESSSNNRAQIGEGSASASRRRARARRPAHFRTGDSPVVQSSDGRQARQDRNQWQHLTNAAAEGLRQQRDRDRARREQALNAALRAAPLPVAPQLKSDLADGAVAGLRPHAELAGP